MDYLKDLSVAGTMKGVPGVQVGKLCSVREKLCE